MSSRSSRTRKPSSDDEALDTSIPRRIAAHMKTRQPPPELAGCTARLERIVDSFIAMGTEGVDITKAFANYAELDEIQEALEAMHPELRLRRS